MNLTPEFQQVLDAAFICAGRAAIPARDFMARFDEVLDVLVGYLVTEGVGVDGEVNPLGDQIETLIDLLVHARISEEESGRQGAG